MPDVHHRQKNGAQQERYAADDIEEVFRIAGNQNGENPEEES